MLQNNQFIKIVLSSFHYNSHYYSLWNGSKDLSAVINGSRAHGCSQFYGKGWKEDCQLLKLLLMTMF